MPGPRIISVASPVSVVPMEAPADQEVDSISLLNDTTKNNNSENNARFKNGIVSDDDQRPWICPASAKSMRTTNPIRAIVDPIAANIQSGEERGDGKDLISLALGDPTVAGNLPPCPVALEAVESALHDKGNAAGYANACGIPEARKAVAHFHSHHADGDEASVVIANGCSGALEIALTALLDPGTILLVPRPGFPLYQVIAESHGASVVHYNLLPDQGWECDILHLQELVHKYGSQVRGILVNNPSNPTGAVFSKAHLESLVNFCQHHRLPIVADEVYGDLTFTNCPFYPMANVAANLGYEVPVITVSGLAKQYLVPGWRVGWIVFQDNKYRSLREVEGGAKKLAQVVLGASHLIQKSIAKLLDPNNSSIQEWKIELRDTLERQAVFLCHKLSQCPGLEVLVPQGAMYAIIRIDVSRFRKVIQSDLEFSSRLLEEENVFVLPGSAFGVPGMFRVVFCAPAEVLEEAASRIHDFCHRHMLV